MRVTALFLRRPDRLRVRRRADLPGGPGRRRRWRSGGTGLPATAWNRHDGDPREDIPAGSVAKVFKKAYKMHDKLIRPAQVTVASAPVKN